MNSKMARNSQLSTTESEKLSKQADRNRIINMEIIWRVISWEVEGGGWGKMFRE